MPGPTASGRPGEGGLLQQLTKQLLDSAFQGEIVSPSPTACPPQDLTRLSISLASWTSTRTPHSQHSQEYSKSTDGAWSPTS